MVKTRILLLSLLLLAASYLFNVKTEFKMIEIKQVNYHIGNASILKNINLTIFNRSITKSIRSNRADKSTLFSLIARLQPLQAGENGDARYQ